MHPGEGRGSARRPARNGSHFHNCAARRTDCFGVHLVGPETPEIVQAIAVAVTMGAKKADLDRTFALHPTTAEELVLLR